jgi:hypothetical protein
VFGGLFRLNFPIQSIQRIKTEEKEIFEVVGEQGDTFTSSWLVTAAEWCQDECET